MPDILASITFWTTVVVIGIFLLGLLTQGEFFGLVRSNKFKYCECCHAKLKQTRHDGGFFGGIVTMRCPKCGHEVKFYESYG